MRLTKYEKETIILFNEEDELASIYTYNMKLKDGWQNSVESIRKSVEGKRPISKAVILIS